jgi:SET and MYND domain-containing protein 4
MFCSTACMQKAEENFHNFECEIIEILHKSGIMQMAMRVFLQALNMFDGSVEKLEKFLENYEKSSTSVFDFNFSATQKDEKENARNFLASLYCLARSGKNSNDSPKNIFMSSLKLTKIWNDHQKFIENFFKRVLCVGDSNFHGICGWSIQKFRNQDPQMIGIGCYPFISLVNHSCYPNVTRQYFEGKMMLVVERPIKKGEQLYDCYK